VDPQEERALERAKDVVRQAVLSRMYEIGMDTTELARRAGVNERTIERFLPNPETGRQGTHWPYKRKAISVALGWGPTRIDEMLADAMLNPIEAIVDDVVRLNIPTSMRGRLTDEELAEAVAVAEAAFLRYAGEIRRSKQQLRRSTDAVSA
jgi:hypothetical protein